MAGMLIGAFDGTTTNMFLTDALGSVLETISATAGTATVQGNQVYSPYGSSRYQQGTMGTAKGFTGQYTDSVSGLDYYGARYYDPVVGRFLSADALDGNLAGMDPYAYVGGNPETFSDPTGQRFAPPPGEGGSGGGSQNPPGGNSGLTLNGPGPSGPPPSLQTHHQNVNPGPVTSSDEFNPVQALEICFALGPECVIAAVAGVLSVVTQPAIKLDPGTVPQPWGVSLRSKSSTEAGRTGDTGGIALRLQPQNNTTPSGKSSVTSTGGPCSFAPNTLVTTAQGEEPIGKLKVGEQVLAYNPKMGKMELEPILHVWINHDHDLVDLTITTTTKGEHGKPATRTSELVHTNQKHPFFTREHGFLPVGQIKLGMHVLRADGRVGVVTGWKVVPGTKTMYNLEVAQDHTFTVGSGQWVVHNKCSSSDYKKLRTNLANDTRPVLSGQNPHHVIPCVLRGHNLILASGGLFDINAAYNGRPLWQYNYKSEALGALEPYHANAPSYTRYVRFLMDSEFQRLQSSGTLTSRAAFNSLRDIINRLNSWIDTLGWFGALDGEACGLRGM
jgi:RHS repeat-associated protein